MLCGVLECLCVTKHQAAAEDTAFTLDEGQAVMPVIGAQVVHAVLAALVLESDDVPGEPTHLSMSWAPLRT